MHMCISTEFCRSASAAYVRRAGLPAGVWDAFGTERFNITKNVQKQRSALSCHCSASCIFAHAMLGTRTPRS